MQMRKAHLVQRYYILKIFCQAPFAIPGSRSMQFIIHFNILSHYSRIKMVLLYLLSMRFCHWYSIGIRQPWETMVLHCPHTYETNATCYFISRYKERKTRMWNINLLPILYLRNPNMATSFVSDIFTHRFKAFLLNSVLF